MVEILVLTVISVVLIGCLVGEMQFREEGRRSKQMFDEKYARDTARIKAEIAEYRRKHGDEPPLVTTSTNDAKYDTKVGCG